MEKAAKVTRIVVMIIMATALALTIFVSNTVKVPTGDFTSGSREVEASMAEFKDLPLNLPTFEWFKGEPMAKGCMATEKWNAKYGTGMTASRWPNDALVVTLDGQHHRIPMNVAWARLTDKSMPKNTYWIVGNCY